MDTPIELLVANKVKRPVDNFRKRFTVLNRLPFVGRNTDQFIGSAID